MSGDEQSTFPSLVPMDRQSRLRDLRASVASAGCAAMVITKPENIRWLTGFTGSNGTVVLTESSVMVLTDGRYRTQVDQQLGEAAVEAEVRIGRDLVKLLTEVTEGSATIGLEAENVTWSFKRELMTALAPTEKLLATSAIVEELRKVKDAGEISRLRRAAAITDEALDLVRPNLSKRLSEKAIAQQLAQHMTELGADDVSFPLIVASGPNSALPHASPTDRVIGHGDFVVVDIGAKVDGYGSDMTRTFVIGEPSPEQHRMIAAVTKAQARGIEGVRAGTPEARIDEICRASLAEDGLAEAFIHGTGHAIGLEIHENPILSARADGMLRSGYVITVEPGAYVPDIGGVRVEDSVIVTDDGCTPITKSPKEPVVS